MQLALRSGCLLLLILGLSELQRVANAQVLPTLRIERAADEKLLLSWATAFSELQLDKVTGSKLRNSFNVADVVLGITCASGSWQEKRGRG